MFFSGLVVMLERNGVVEADEVEDELLVLLGVAHVDDGVLHTKKLPRFKAVIKFMFQMKNVTVF